MNVTTLAMFALAVIVLGTASASTIVFHSLHDFHAANRLRRSPRGRGHGHSQGHGHGRGYGHGHGHGHGGYRRPRYGKGRKRSSPGFVQQINDGLEQAVNQAKLFNRFIFSS